MSRARTERGQSLVEFSLSVMIFIMIIVGVVEVGRAVWSYNTLASAAREGSRYAMVHGAVATAHSGPAANDAKVQAAVAKYSSNLEPSDLTITSAWPDGNNAVGSHVKVTATYRFDTLFSRLLGVSPITMTSTSTMTITN
jgi:Flp pilus assembly protein TadG